MRITSALAGLGLSSCLALAMACSGSDALYFGDGGTDASDDAARIDSGSTDTDAGHDGGFRDTGSAVDTGAVDTGAVDTGSTDTGAVDTGSTDTGAALDTGALDTGTADGRGGAGCESSAACLVGQACDTATGQCTSACSPTQTCNGGCCNGGTCALGTAPTACGPAGATCHSCTGAAAGSECLANGTCGCKSASDCPEHQACDTTARACTDVCSLAQPCNGGCCSGGACAAGTSSIACGSTGATCASCTGLTTGDACLADGACGCKSANDCPLHQACDVATGACSTACSSAQPCHGGCCNGGTCALGTGEMACGLTGTTCTSCAQSELGTVCTAGGTCGCTAASQCPADQACNPTSGMCGAICSATQPCNGGCCNGGTCAPGTGPRACGTGPSCASCVGLASGSACLAGGICGCASATDCPSGQSCDATGTCTTCDPSTEVSFGGHCYYLDGSAGLCDTGYSVQSNASLAAILAASPNAWEGKTYRHTLPMTDCCVGTSNTLAEYGMTTTNCTTAGPFSARQPILYGNGCIDYLMDLTAPGQMTLCGL
jgi:hypothetical protein